MLCVGIEWVVGRDSRILCPQILEVFAREDQNLPSFSSVGQAFDPIEHSNRSENFQLRWRSWYVRFWKKSQWTNLIVLLDATKILNPRSKLVVGEDDITVKNMQNQIQCVILFTVLDVRFLNAAKMLKWRSFLFLAFVVLRGCKEYYSSEGGGWIIRYSRFIYVFPGVSKM